MQLNNKNIWFIGVPFCYGANQEGTQYAPGNLIEYMQLHDSVYSMLNISRNSMSTVGFRNSNVKNYQDVLLMKKVLKVEMSHALDNYEHVIVLGGDHSISMGSIASVVEKYPNVGVIWIDAHTDINTETTSLSGNAHGMPLASLMGICDTAINNNAIRLDPKNVFWIGVRDIDEGEWKNIGKLGIEKNVFTREIIRKLGIRKIIQDIQTVLLENSVEFLHISFDIDVMDPTIVAATGTLVPDGFDRKECEELIEELFKTGMPKVVSIDFVEYNPLMDSDNHTGSYCIELLSRFVNLLN